MTYIGLGYVVDQGLRRLDEEAVHVWELNVAPGEGRSRFNEGDKRRDTLGNQTREWERKLTTN